MVTYTDSTKTLSWRAVVAIPAGDYNSFIIDCMIITGVLMALTLALMVYFISLPVRFFKKVNSLGRPFQLTPGRATVFTTKCKTAARP